MPSNGDARGLILETIDSLVFPDSISADDQELVRAKWREDPSMLDALADVDQLYQFIMGTADVARETKEQIVAGLQHYMGTEGTAYAAMVGVYLIELKDVIPDKMGFRLIFNGLERFELIFLDRD